MSSVPPASPQLDPALAPWLTAAAGDELQAVRSGILADRAVPVLDATLRQRGAYGRLPREDAEEIRSAALERVVRALESIRQGRGAVVISRFDAYAASCARMAWLDFQRARAPERVRLLHRLRFLLEGRAGDRRFAWHEDASGEGRAGLVGQTDEASPEMRARLRADPAGTIQHWLGARTDVPSLPLPALLERVLRAIGGRIPFEALLEAVAAAHRLNDLASPAATWRPEERPLRALPPAPVSAGPVELDPPSPHSGPDYRDLAAAAGGQLEAEALTALELRAAASPQLAAELADLRALAAAGPATEVSLPPPPNLPRPSEVLDFAPTPKRSQGARRLLAAAAMVVLALGIWWLQSRPPGLPADLQALADEALQAQNVDRWLGPDLKPAPVEPSGSPAENEGPLAQAPRGTALREAPPRLQWSPRAGAQNYRVSIERVENGDIQTSPLLSAEARDWAPTQPLVPGALYRWHVEALGADGVALARSPKPPEPEARFRVLPLAALEALRREEARASGNALVIGVLRARAGLRDEARAAFAEAARSGHPAAAKLSAP